MKWLIIFLFLISNGFPVKVNADCWKSVSNSKVYESWRNSNDEKFLSVKGDFQGNGQMNFARIEISCNAKNLALFAYTKNKSHKFNRHFLTYIPTDQLQAYGVRLKSSNIYNGACAKGYFECEPKQESAKIEFDSIELFKYQGVKSIFYWDKITNKFMRLWTED